MQPLRPRPSLLGTFWFGIQVVWGALLGVSLQARAADLAGSHALAVYGLLASAGAAVAAVTQITAGIVADRRRARGSKRVEFYVSGAGVAACALLWFYAAPDVAQLVAAVIVLQVAMNVAIGPYQAVIPDFLPDSEVGTASAWMAALQSAGNACGALVAALVANRYAAAGAIGVVLLITCMVTSAHVRRLALLPARAQALRFSRAFVDLFISRAFVFLGFYTLLGYLFFYVRESFAGDTKTLTGSIILTVTASGAAGAILAARPCDRYDRRFVAATGASGFAVAVVAFLFSHSIAALLLSAVLAGTAWGVFLSGDWALGCRYLPRVALATAMGVWNLALLVPQILAPLLATAALASVHALNSSGAPRTAFVLAALETLVGIAWIRRLPATVSLVEAARSGNTP